MDRYTPYAGGVIALIVGILFVALAVSSFWIGKPMVVSHVTTTIAVLPQSQVAVAPVTPPFSQAATASTSDTVAQKPIPTPKLVTSTSVAPPVETASVVTAPALVASPVALSAAAATLRGALVNILCYARPGTPFHSMSASGVMVTSSGTILTNAHVAQYFLLANKGVVCTIRTGSPAVDAYTATLEYIPKSWLLANSGVLLEAAPSGTGEHDYALLAVSGSATNKPLPTSFPHIPLGTTAELVGTPVVIASFGAQFLTTAQVQTSLFPTIVYGTIKAVYTFVAHSIDVFALGGTAAAQEGSSGGGVANAAGQLVGTITTSTVTGDTSSRELNAITAAYIRADYASATGEPLDFLLSRSSVDAATTFAANIPALEALVVQTP